jgi:hypothetical protein
LAFIHYRVNKAVLRGRIPPDLEIDEYDGSAWVGFVPFEMYDVMLGGWPSIRPLRRFPELNLRTYVQRNGRTGIWFFSLDADCWPVVLGGRLFYQLPYFKAKMAHRADHSEIDFESQRKGGTHRFRARYRPQGEVYLPKIGTFEYWIAERYCLYIQFSGETHRLEVHHEPWPIQNAEVSVLESNMLGQEGLLPLDPNPVTHYSSGVEVVTFKATNASTLLDPIMVSAAGTVEQASRSLSPNLGLLRRPN